MSPTELLGNGTALVALAFGVLFFVFAVRYYIGTITVLFSSYSSPPNGKNGGQVRNGTSGAGEMPLVSVHVPLYNEKNVARRILEACSMLEYPNYEVIVADDSTDETVQILRDWALERGENSRFKIIHRDNRKGFKGGALNEALKKTDPDAKYVLVFDADFVPPPDTINKILDYFNRHNGNNNGNGASSNGRYSNGQLAAVQGYQWHTLNRGENWLTRGVTCEYSGNYMIDRTFEEVSGTMKMVAGSVFMIRADLLRRYEWSESLTEDWELTLRLYSDGYKVLYTPLIQAPAECPSTLGYLIRQRMRWAEGHTFNVKKYFARIMVSPKISIREKLEFLYFTVYYLQSVLLVAGSALWFTSDVVIGTRLPFWTSQFGWTLAFTNLLALPLMSAAGLFLEKRGRRDFPGLFTQFLLFYALAPYQAYAALKGLLEYKEGQWFRTLKTGKISGFLGRLELRKVTRKVLPPGKRGVRIHPRTAGRKRVWSATVVIVALTIFSLLLVRGSSAQPSPDPNYYFYLQPAPPSYHPFSQTPPGFSFMMHLVSPSGIPAIVPIGASQGSGPLFFSDPAPNDLSLPAGASVSISVWVQSPQEVESLSVQIEIYNPQTNAVQPINGAGPIQIQLNQGLNLYTKTWGQIGRNQVIPKGGNLMASIWLQNERDTEVPQNGQQTDVFLLFNSSEHQSSIDFPITVSEDLIPTAGAIAVASGVVGIWLRHRRRSREIESHPHPPESLRDTQRILIVAAALIFLTLPLVFTFNEFLTFLVASSGLESLISPIVPYEAAAVSFLLHAVGLDAGNAGSQVWIGGGPLPIIASIDWNCSGWQSFVLFAVTCSAGMRGVPRRREQLLVIAMGVCGVFAVNVLRIYLVVMLAYFAGYPTAILFHDYGGTVLSLLWLLTFWALVLKHSSDAEIGVKT